VDLIDADADKLLGKRAEDARGHVDQTIRAKLGSMRRNSDRSVVRTRIASAPAISTPVGPAPTRTNVNRSRWRCRVLFGLRLLEGSQNVISDRTASARLLSPGAKRANSSWPK